MAINIDSQKTKTTQSTWVNLLFYPLLILFIVSFVSSVALFLLCEYSKNTIAKTEKRIEEKRTPEMLALEEEVVLTQKRINDFSKIIGLHRVNSRFFNDLEGLTHPSFYFSNIDLQISNGKVILSGITEDFETLGQQFFILEEKDYIKSVNLTKADITEGARVGFAIEVIFNSNQFKF